MYCSKSLALYSIFGDGISALLSVREWLEYVCVQSVSLLPSEQGSRTALIKDWQVAYYYTLWEMPHPEEVGQHHVQDCGIQASPWVCDTLMKFHSPARDVVCLLWTTSIV